MSPELFVMMVQRNVEKVKRAVDTTRVVQWCMAVVLCRMPIAA